MELKKGFGNLAVASMVKADWNYKVDDAEKAAKLTANIKRNGQVENLIVRPIGKGKFEVVNGNHRLDAFTKLGMKEAMVFNTGKISDAAARRLAVETNETKFDSDPLKLADILETIMGEFGQSNEFLETFPMSHDEIVAMMELPKYVVPDAPEDLPGKKKNIDNEFLKKEVDAAKLLSTLGVSSLTTEEAETVAMAVMEEKTRLGGGTVNPRNGGNVAFVNIFKSYLNRLAKMRSKQKGGGDEEA